MKYFKNWSIDKVIKDKEKIAIVGLGYVGLPLAIEFARHFEVIGFDLNTKRIDELTKGFDRTNEVDSKDLNNSSKLLYTSDSKKPEANTIHCYCSTPIDEFNVPDLEPLKSASKIIGKHISSGDTIIYESTVYPGLLKVCVPILELELLVLIRFFSWLFS